MYKRQGKFGAPTGITALPDDRLLVANFDRDSLLLLDIQGVVHQIFKDLPTPKAVMTNHFASSLQAIVATRKEAVILDLTTGKVVVRSKLRGFYPWNIQLVPDENLYAGKTSNVDERIRRTFSFSVRSVRRTYRFSR